MALNLTMRKKTHDEFKEEVYSLVNDEYTLLEEYKGAKSKIKIRHNICGHIYKVRPDAFLKGSRCPECRVKAITKTHKQFVEDVYQAVGEEYTVIGEYINSKKKIRMKHNICDNEWDVYPCSFLSNEKRCPYCSGLMRKTPEEFKKEVFELVGNEYAVLSDYKNNHTKVKMRHEKCGYEWRVIPISFLQGSRCPKCFGTAKKTTVQFKENVFTLVGKDYTVINEYINAKTKILIRHNKCGHEYLVTPSDFLSGKRCPKCGAIRRTDKQFKKIIFDLVGEEYVFLEKYINSYTKIRVKHNKCGKTYKTTPDTFIYGSRCPHCNSSKGELKIANFLTKNNIDFEVEKTFEDLKHKGFLRFDFYLPEYNLLIEYDGKQHFEPVDFSGNNPELAIKNFKLRKKRDALKDNYAKDKGIKLLRIPYTKYDEIKHILKEKLKKQAEPNVNVSGTWK